MGCVTGKGERVHGVFVWGVGGGEVNQGRVRIVMVLRWSDCVVVVMMVVRLSGLVVVVMAIVMLAVMIASNSGDDGDGDEYDNGNKDT